MEASNTRGLLLVLIAAVGCMGDAGLEPSVVPAAAALHDGSTIQTSDGPVHGTRQNGSRVFIGIPYAAPPLGELRWKPPAPVAPWEQVLEASGPGRTCLQLAEVGAPPPPAPAPEGEYPEASEDCLQLNVFAPERNLRDPVPVLVWLHGGGNTSGSANDVLLPGARTYDGARLRAAAPREVIVVTINYRLSQLGFLAHPALSHESDHGVSGNYGLLDQQAALRWVQKNIRAFGGDPENVTLFGESAGSFDTCYHAVLEGSEGLFHRMIMESGSCLLKVATLEEAEADGQAHAEQVGCPGSGEQALECLRAKPGAEIQQRPYTLYPGLPLFLPADPPRQHRWGAANPGVLAVVDGVHLKEQPITAYAEGRYARVPAIIGSNAREAAAYYLDSPSAFENETQYLAAIEATFGTSGDRVAERYAADRYESANDAAIELSGDFYFVCPAWNLARLMSRHSDVYLYSWNRALNTPEYEHFGPTHGVELAWVWDFWSAGFGVAATELELTQRVAGYWTALAETGDPNREGAPLWPKYVEGQDQELELDLAPRVVEGRRDARCPLWNKVLAEQWGKRWAVP